MAAVDVLLIGGIARKSKAHCPELNEATDRQTDSHKNCNQKLNPPVEFSTDSRTVNDVAMFVNFMRITPN